MIRIDDITVAYSKSKQVLEDISLTLKGGRIYGLLGENGVGKSTLLKSIAGLVYPKKGQVNTLGYDARERHPAMLEQLFFIPEELELPFASIRSFRAAMAPFYPLYSEEDFDSLLNEFSVPKDAKLNSLSFGQRKKMVIAFALATNVPLLIMDEPTNGLDIPSKSQFRKLLTRAMSEERCILISTHQIRDLDNLIDHVLILSQNAVLVDHSLETLGRKLNFAIHKHVPDHSLYSEPHLMGFQTIEPNQSAQDSRVDLELFFKGVLINKSGITKILADEVL